MLVREAFGQLVDHRIQLQDALDLVAVVVGAALWIHLGFPLDDSWIH